MRMRYYFFAILLLISCNKKEKNEPQLIKPVRNTSEYTIEKEINLLNQEIYDAFTRPRSMKSWLPDNTKLSVKHKKGGRISLGLPKQNSYTYINGYFKEVNPPHSLELVYFNANPLGTPERDTISIKIKTIEGGSSISIVDRVRNEAIKQKSKKLGDSFVAGLSWKHVLDLIEKNMIQEKYKALKINIPDDLEVIYYKGFKGIFYGSSNGQIFASLYFEEGPFQGDVIIELNDEEKKYFKRDRDGFLDEYSKKVGQSYFSFKDKRHIYEFNHIADTGSLIAKWRKENE